jgi:hypothetical protein
VADMLPATVPLVLALGLLEFGPLRGRTYQLPTKAYWPACAADLPLVT